MFATSGAGEMCAVGEYEGVLRASASLSDCGGRGRVSVASLAVSGRLPWGRVPRHEGCSFFTSCAECRGMGSPVGGPGLGARSAAVRGVSGGGTNLVCRSYSDGHQSG